MSLPAALRDQAGHCAALGSPFMERLLTMLADQWPENSALAEKCATFSGDIGPGGASLPLRIAGGLHALVLTGQAVELAQVYPPHIPSNETFQRVVLTAIQDHTAFLLDWIDSPPQTNEVRRSAALIAAGQVVAAQFARPIVLSELGASGGLNLMWDRFALNTGIARFGPDDAALTLQPDWTGPQPPAGHADVAARAGVDLNPLNAKDDADALRLYAYLWPDQPHRIDLTRAAIGAFDAKVDRRDAIDWLEHRLHVVPAGHVHMIYHTVAWQYFPTDAQARGQAMIEAAGAAATADSPLAWFGMENDGAKDGAALTLRLWPGDITLDLGRADFHGRWVRWTYQHGGIV